MNEQRQLTSERHTAWKAENLAALQASGVPFERRPESCLFRQPGKPKVDFYPSTGRWREVGAPRAEKLIHAEGVTFRGGAVAFLKWYARQSR